MNTHIIPEADLPGVAQNALCTMEIGTLYNHHGLWLEFTKAAGAAMSQAEIEADIAHITITVKKRGGPNVPLLSKIPPAVIFDILNAYREKSKSAYTYAGGMYIPYTREDLNKLVNPYALVIGMADIDNYILQVQFNNVVLTTVKVTVKPEIDKEPIRPIGEHIRIERWERSFASATKEPVPELPYGEPGTAMLGYHIALGATGVCDDVEVQLNGDFLHNPLTIQENNIILHKARRTPDAAYFHVDFNRKGSALPVGTAKSFRQGFNWSVAPNGYNVYTEMVYNLGAPNYPG